MNFQGIAPIIALVGTLAIGLLGFYQWRKQYSNPNRAANAAARREAYEGLWHRLQEIDLSLRREQGDRPSLSEQLRDINAYFLLHSLHFEDEDQAAINEYVTAMYVLERNIRLNGDPAIVENFNATAMFQKKPMPDEVGKAWVDVERLRKQIKKNVQRVAGSV